MSSMSSMPSIEDTSLQRANNVEQSKARQDFHFISSQSIAANFGNLIARSEKKVTKHAKPKAKKRHREHQTVNHEPQALTQSLNERSIQLPVAQPLTFFKNNPFRFDERNLVPQVKGGEPVPQSKWQEAWNAVDDLTPNDVEGSEHHLSEDMELSSGSEADSPIPPSAKQGGPNTVQHISQSKPNSTQETDSSDGMDLSSGPEYDDGGSIDHSSLSRRPSSTPFIDSAASSHTTGVGPSESSKMEADIMKSSLRVPSPRSDTSSQLTPAESLTPAPLKPIAQPVKTKIKGRIPKTKRVNFSEQKVKTLVAQKVPRDTVAQQGNHAALASRLKPFELHPQEYQLLKDHICHAHVTAYLNIRNRILRLWVRNPLVQVTQEEAIGCVQSARFTELAKVAYEWLVRKGYINFGCLEIASPSDSKSKKGKGKRAKRKTIAIVGAGMAGLGCARQIEGLVRHYQEKWTLGGEDPPHVIVLEGRNRVGGRIYSHPFKNQAAQGLPANKRCTAEMGAHIIIGFDHGNPLNMIVRGQLALHHHTLKAATRLYDTDGSLVNEKRDAMVQDLFNDVLERAGQYRHRIPLPSTVQGDEILIQEGKDPTHKGGPTISEIEQNTPNVHGQSQDLETESVPGGLDKLTGKAYMVTGPRRKKKPALTAQDIGFEVSNALDWDDLNLDDVARESAHPTLGAAMDESVKQYSFILDLTPEDLRMMNWHYANLEYANAANVGKLSLGGWDQDTGNEFTGGHAQIIGGYQQVPRALLHCPSKLDLRTRKIVKKIEYNIWSGNSKTPGARIQCEDGEQVEADYVVLTSPLGVLKNKDIEFSPPLPDWKLGPIDRLGFGLLNKCVLVYKEPFWDVEQDMFGVLREPEVHNSTEQEDYSANRGKFYFFWNCIKTSGRPVLIGLIVGDAAYEAEKSSDADLVNDATQQLSKIFKDKVVPPPEETIVTRWQQDRFARGTYSNVGPEAIPGDYDTMAARVGNLYFAGEATCATHPATVHGAYISGLRAASEILEDLLGPIEIPTPLVTRASTAMKAEGASSETPSRRASSQPQKQHVNLPVGPTAEASRERDALLDRYEAEIIDLIRRELGVQPSQGKVSKMNGYLLYVSENWIAMKGSPLPKSNKPSKDAIRAELSVRWEGLPNSEKQTWKEKAEAVNVASAAELMTYKSRLYDWNKRAIALRKKYIEEHPGVLTQAEEKRMWDNLLETVELESSERKAKRLSGYADARDPVDISMSGM